MNMDVLLNWQKIGIFAIFTFILAHALMYHFRNKPRAHAVAIYFSTLLGGFSLLLGLYQSDEQLAKWWRPNFELQRLSALELLTNQIESERKYYCDSPKAVRSEYSPANFDEIVAAEAETCRTMRALAVRSREWASSTDDISLPELRAEHFRMAMPEQSAQILREYAGFHNESAKELRRLDEVTAPTPLLQTITILGPYAFIAAFMVGLASIAFPIGSPKRDFWAVIRRLLLYSRKSAGDQ
jgi:hypothetical protein